MLHFFQDHERNNTRRAFLIFDHDRLYFGENCKEAIALLFAAAFQDLPAELDAEVLQRVPFVPVVSEHHPLAAQASISLSSLLAEPFFFCPRESDSGVLYDRIAELHGRNFQVVQEVSNIHILLGLIAANLGVSLVAASATTLSFSGVVYRPLSDLHHDLAFQTVLLWQRDDPSPVLREFLLWPTRCLHNEKARSPTLKNGSMQSKRESALKPAFRQANQRCVDTVAASPLHDSALPPHQTR